MAGSVLRRNAFTFTEWHAAVLGGGVGALAAYLHRIAYSNAGVGLALTFVAVTLGWKIYDRSTAGRTLRKEPWYALGAFLAAGAVVLVAL